MAAAQVLSGAQADFPFREPAPHFPEERSGWKGYVERERYPEKKKKAEQILSQYNFPGPPEFQLVPLPNTNPLIEGVRWKQYHYALGDTMKDMPATSWEYVKKEKAADMIHILQFPYNGEPPRVGRVKAHIAVGQG